MKPKPEEVCAICRAKNSKAPEGAAFATMHIISVLGLETIVSGLCPFHREIWECRPMRPERN